MTPDLPGVFFKHRSAIEEALRQVVMGEAEAEHQEKVRGRPSPLYRMMEYHLGWTDEGGGVEGASEGERVRATLCLLACEALGGPPRRALPAAAAVELVHNFCLIHNDVQYGSPERRRRPTVWWVWGPAQAINAGNAMHALARLALLDLHKTGVAPAKVLQAVGLLDQTVLEVIEGEEMDIRFQERVDVSVDSYLRMARLKTGALIGCSLELGALLATDDAAVISAFGEAGRKLGVAFQIHDDILDLWPTAQGPEAMPPGDILSKRRALPVVYAMEQADVHLRRQLGILYQKRVLEPSDVPQVLALLDQVQAREYAQKRAEELSTEAIRELEEAVPAGTDLRGIREAAGFLATRTG